jgi:cytochrome c-type biogenesis protein CcmH
MGLQVEKRSVLPMMMFLKLGVLTMILAGWTPLGATTVEEVAAGLMCPCEDNCNQMLSTCQCGDADHYRAEIRERLLKGETKDQITAWFVGKYGEKALSAPTTHGFNVTAWIMPFIAILIGGVILRSVLVRWKRGGEKETADRRNGGGGDADGVGETVRGKEEPHKEENDPYLKRVEKELEDYQ